MSDVPVRPVEVPTQPVTRTGYPAGSATDGGAKEKAREVAAQTGQASREAAADVKDTAKEQARKVGQEAKAQASNLASDVRDRVSGQARGQNDRLVTQIRQTADQLDEMRGDRGDSPAAAVVSRVADGGRQFADYLDRNGPEGVLREVQDFARRRPGAFLATALAAGFVVGRLGKSVAKADPNAGTGKPESDSFVARPDKMDEPVTPPDYAPPSYAAPSYAKPGYPMTPTGSTYASATEYSSTGTGTPVVREEYVVESPERPR